MREGRILGPLTKTGAFQLSWYLSPCSPHVGRLSAISQPYKLSLHKLGRSQDLAERSRYDPHLTPTDPQEKC
jgi:hypothetical protein